MLLNSKIVNKGQKLVPFKLLSVDGKIVNHKELVKKNGLVISFICNHCPYVKDIINRIVIDFNELNSLEVGTVAIMPNDVDSYPEDSYENMIIFAKENNFKFHYLYDKNQLVARDYNAVCTPDFFCFDKNNELFYRGRLDDLKYKSKSFLSRKKDLVNAVKLNIKKGLTIDNQNSSMGCSIKWKKLYYQLKEPL